MSKPKPPSKHHHFPQKTHPILTLQLKESQDSIFPSNSNTLFAKTMTSTSVPASGHSGAIRVPAPHLPPYRPSTSVPTSSLGGVPHGMPSHPAPSNAPASSSLSSQRLPSPMPAISQFCPHRGHGYESTGGFPTRNVSATDMRMNANSQSSINLPNTLPHMSDSASLNHSQFNKSSSVPANSPNSNQRLSPHNTLTVIPLRTTLHQSTRTPNFCTITKSRPFKLHLLPQHYQYPPYFQPLTPTSGPFTPTPAVHTQGEISTSVVADQKPLSLDTSNGNSNVVSNGVGAKGRTTTSAYQDPRFGFDGARSPVPWLDAPIFSDGQPRPVTSTAISSSISSGNNGTASRNQTYCHRRFCFIPLSTQQQIGNKNNKAIKVGKK